MRACRQLHQTLLLNLPIRAVNKDKVIETLREIAELLVWGDQHADCQSFFEYEGALIAFA
jgi:hypothetical protein